MLLLGSMILDDSNKQSNPPFKISVTYHNRRLANSIEKPYSD